MYALDGQVVVVTGSGSGIGAGIAQRLGLAGASVAVADLNQDGADACAAKLGEEGIQAIGDRLDVSD